MEYKNFHISKDDMTLAEQGTLITEVAVGGCKQQIRFYSLFFFCNQLILISLYLLLFTNKTSYFLFLTSHTAPTLLFCQHKLNDIDNLNVCIENGNFMFIVAFTFLKIAA